MGLLSKRIQDQRFLSLIRKWLRAGYIEDWKYHKTHSGTPQGGILSPMLANVYLHELDEWAGEQKANFDHGTKRRANKEYRKREVRLQRARNQLAEVGKQPTGSPTERIRLLRDLKRLRKEIKESAKAVKSIPSKDPYDRDFRRFLYCRYADDVIIGIIGSKEEANHILGQVKEFLWITLRLELSAEKTRINHNQDKTRFLGYGISTKKGPPKLTRVWIKGKVRTKRTTTSAMVYLSIPQDKISAFCKDRGIGSLEEPVSKVKQRGELINLEDMEIVGTYNAELRGFVQHYALADRAKEE